jgi:hypothetical protein
MKARTLKVMCALVVACLAVAAPILAQRGAAAPDPLTGTWTGDWGPSAQDRNQVSVDLKYDGKALTGTVKSIQPSRPDVSISNSSFDAASKAVKMEAEATSRGQTVKYVISGKLEGNVMTGSWNHDGRTGDFKLTKK